MSPGEVRRRPGIESKRRGIADLTSAISRNGLQEYVEPQRVMSGDSLDEDLARASAVHYAPALPGDYPHSFLKRVDEYLYTSKRSGRNRVSF